MSGEENRALVGRLADEVLTQHNLAALDDNLPCRLRGE